MTQKTLPDQARVVIRDAGNKMSQQNKTTLVRLLEHPRFELLPIKGMEQEAAHLAKGAKVTVTCSTKQGVEATLRATEKLSEQGLCVVPHISARSVIDRTHLKNLFRSLSDIGVKEIFVPGGDRKEPAGCFTSSFELLTEIAELGYNFEEIGVAVYPEGHPFIDKQSLFQALRQKEPLATYMVTQMCFDPGTIVDWIADMRRRGIGLPVIIGIAGVLEKAKLLQVSMKIGVGDSVRFLGKNIKLVGRIFRPGGYKPDEVIRGLLPCINDQEYQVQGLHIYSFNRVENTERWRRKTLHQMRQ